MLDAITFENRGIPAAVVITEPFEASAEAMARLAGMAGCPSAATPQPFGNLGPADVSARADKVVDRVAQLLLEN